MALAKINKENRIYEKKETSDKIGIGIGGISFVSKNNDENLETYKRKQEKTQKNKK